LARDLASATTTFGTGRRTKFKTVRFTSPTTSIVLELKRAESQTQSRLTLEVE
jgi:hypothetical protein